MEQARAVTGEAEQPAPCNVPPSVARCKSCGGPSAEGELCSSCQQAFAPVLAGPTLTPASDNSTTVVAAVAPPPAVAEAAPTSYLDSLKVETVKAEPVRIEQARQTRRPIPPVVARRPIAPAPPPPRQNHTQVLAAVGLAVVVAIGLYQGVRKIAMAREGQPRAGGRCGYGNGGRTPSDHGESRRQGSRDREDATDAGCGAREIKADDVRATARDHSPGELA